jgi:hydroxypyruvate isomerase
MSTLTRRSAIGRLTGAAAALAVSSNVQKGLKAADDVAASTKLKNNVNHSVCKWCYDKIPLEDFCQSAKTIGLQSVELLKVDDFPTLKKHGLQCAMVSGVPGGITKGLNRKEHHDEIVKWFEEATPTVAEHGYPNIICFSGNRAGMSDEEGLENCAIGLKRIAPIVEKYKVNACMELLNSKRNHPDYMCDHTKWGVELVKKVGSERFKLLYDIYHMQIMEGDLIRTIKGNIDFFGHFHTGGNPGRNEIDDSQEVNWHAVAKAIADTGYQGFLSHEFIPVKTPPIKSLEEAYEICKV